MVDPRAADFPSFSPYNYVINNPLNATDPDGEGVNFLAGAIIGGTVDFAIQVGAGLAQGNTFSEAVSNVNIAQVGISALAGAASSGVSSLARIGTVGKLLANAGVNATAGAAGNLASGEKVTAQSIGADIIIGSVSTALGKAGQAAAQTTSTATALAKNAKRLTNIANTGGPRAAQTARAATAQAKAQGFGAGSVATSFTTAGTQGAGAALNPGQPIQPSATTNPTVSRPGVANSDNTRTVIKIKDLEK